MESLMLDALSLIKELTEERDGFENLAHTAIETQNRMSDTIEELTEENERLRDNNKQLVNDNAELKNQIQEEIAEEDINLFEEFTKLLHEGIREARADTVRKMQSEINKTLSALCKGDVSEIHRMIDQIAKEMLEEEK
jgi:predicted transcriptional regulator